MFPFLQKAQKKRRKVEYYTGQENDSLKSDARTESFRVAGMVMAAVFLMYLEGVFEAGRDRRFRKTVCHKPGDDSYDKKHPQEKSGLVREHGKHQEGLVTGCSHHHRKQGSEAEQTVGVH